MSRFLPTQIALGLVLLVVPWSTAAYSITMGLALLTSLLSLRRGSFAHRHAFLFPSLVWITALLLSYWWSDAPRAGDEARTYYPFLLVFVASSAITTRKQGMGLMVVYWLAAISAAIAAILEHYCGIGVPPLNGRYSGFLTVVTYAMVVVNGYIVCAVLFCCAEQKSTRIVVLLSSLLIVAAIDLNGTRAAILAIGLALVSLFLFLPNKRKRLIAFVSPVFLMAFLLPDSNISARFSAQPEQLDFSDNKVDIRQTLWVSAWRMTVDHPWMGVGVGGYRPERDRQFAAGEMEGHRKPGPGYDHAHNIPLHILATMGCLGLAAAIYWFGSYPLWFFRRRRIYPPAAALAVALIMVALGFGTLETALLNSRTSGVLAICLGACLGVIRAESANAVQGREPTSSSP